MTSKKKKKKPKHQLVYEPRGAAKELWKSKAPEILIEGPAGTGKSRGILEKILALAVKYPGSRHLICRKTRASMTQSVLVTFEQKVLPVDSKLKDGPQREQRHSYRLPNGSEIVVGGLDKPERTFSTEYDTVTVFEAIEATENDWELLTRALRNYVMPYQQAIADTNPGHPGHWLNKRASNPNLMLRLKSKHEDNPIYYNPSKGKYTKLGRQYIQGTLDRLTGVRKERLRFGRWCAVEGAIYPEFRREIHVIKPFIIPPEWRKYRVIDFGFNNPFVCQWWAEDWDSNLYMFHEIYYSRRIVEDHAKNILDFHGLASYEATIADHDAEDRATLERHGVSTLPAMKEVKPGIEGVQARLRAIREKPNKWGARSMISFFADARVELDPRLEEDKLPTQTVDEIEGYIWKPPVEGKNPKEEPEKENDHGMDAMRYLVAYVDGLPHGDPIHGEETGYVGAATTSI